MEPLSEKPTALLSYYDDMPCNFHVFNTGVVRDYLSALLQRCESEKSAEEIKAILKDGLDF